MKINRNWIKMDCLLIPINDNRWEQLELEHDTPILS